MKTNANMHLRAAFALLASWSAASCAIAADTARLFDIEEQTLASALSEFARQSDRQILFSTQIVDAKRTDGIKGKLEPEHALKKILKGTGLTFRVTADQTILVDKHADTANVSVSAKAIRLAQSGGSESQAPAERTRRDTDDSSDDPEIEDIGEIIVTGTQIRGVHDLAVPVDVYGRDEMIAGGYFSPQDLFDDIPQNFSEISPDASLGRGLTRLGFDNRERASAANLRGLGSESTLTLVNGTRRAGTVNGRVVDISAIPSIAIDRVEIVTGGQSSIYGADAVAGVVNFVTRRQYSGLEVQALGGLAGDGGERLQAAAIGGADNDHGSFVAAYEYSEEWPFNLVDRDLVRANDPSFIDRYDRIETQTRRRRHSAYASGSWNATRWLELNADTQYSSTSHEGLSAQYHIAGASALTREEQASSADILNGSIGAVATLARDLRFTGRFTASTADTDLDERFFSDRGGTPPVILDETERTVTRSSVRSLSGVLDGSLPLLDGRPQFALGYERRWESLTDRALENGVEDSFEDADRSINSLFGELRLPLAEVFALASLRRVDVTAGVRWDDYSDFGSTTNPQIGAIFEPIDGFAIKSAYSTAFRAPALYELGTSMNSFVELIPDPNGGQRPLLTLGGDRPRLNPETADTWSVTLDIAPTGTPWLKASISYFDIQYRDRISAPTIASAERRQVLSNLGRYGTLLNTLPTEDQAQAILALTGAANFRNNTRLPYVFGDSLLAAFPNLALFDNRINNISVETVNGLDALLTASFALAGGEFGVSTRMSYVLDHERRILPSAAPQSQLNETGKPADLRLRSKISWTRGIYGLATHVNYVSAYENSLLASRPEVPSWTTVDVSLSLNFAATPAPSLLDGSSLTLFVENAFDKDPPVIQGHPGGLLYDPTNASAFGRFVSLRVARRF